MAQYENDAPRQITKCFKWFKPVIESEKEDFLQRRIKLFL